MVVSSARKAGDVTRRNRGPERQGDRESRPARAGVSRRRGSVGRSLGSRRLEPRAGGGRGGVDPAAVTLPLGLRAGLRAAGCWLRGPAPPPIRLLRLGACSRRRLRCQQTPGASLPGPPLSNSEPVPPTGPAANEGGGGRRFRGARRLLSRRDLVCGWRSAGGSHRASSTVVPGCGETHRVTPALGPALARGPAEPGQW